LWEEIQFYSHVGTLEDGVGIVSKFYLEKLRSARAFIGKER
jgi:hypothetical protein